MDPVVTLDRDEVAALSGQLEYAARMGEHVRIAIDEGGVKMAAGHRGTWSPPFGVQDA